MVSWAYLRSMDRVGEGEVYMANIPYRRVVCLHKYATTIPCTTDSNKHLNPHHTS